MGRADPGTHPRASSALRIQPTGTGKSAQRATEVRKVRLLLTLRQAASFPGAASDTAASNFRCNCGTPCLRAPKLRLAGGARQCACASGASRSGAPTRASSHSDSPRGPGIRRLSGLTNHGPCVAVLSFGRWYPPTRDRRQGPAITGIWQRGTRLRKAAAELQGCPGRSPRILTMFRPAQPLLVVRLLETCVCWGSQVQPACVCRVCSLREGLPRREQNPAASTGFHHNGQACLEIQTSSGSTYLSLQFTFQ